jgi:hypothetical protein
VKKLLKLKKYIIIQLILRNGHFLPKQSI